MHLERQEKDMSILAGAVLLLDGGSGRHDLPAPSTEFLAYLISRLLESIAESIRRGERIPDDIVEKVRRLAQHIHHYIDHYIPVNDSPASG
jgi:hypothetical protein